jgi:hypothetical protein
MPYITGGGSGGGGASSPGFTINYTQVTAGGNLTDTSEATATALISPGAVTFDGSQVLVTVFVPMVTSPTAGNTTFTLFEGATQITRLGQLLAGSTVIDGAPFNCQYQFTPTAGSHTYKVCCFVTSTTGTPAFSAGSGGTNGYPPAFIRFSKV